MSHTSESEAEYTRLHFLHAHTAIPHACRPLFGLPEGQTPLYSDCSQSLSSNRSQRASWVIALPLLTHGWGLQMATAPV